ncbi:hypothetical protein GP915_23455 [Escherichia coli]|nr:hypothetical protein [Escherichia coli]
MRRGDLNPRVRHYQIAVTTRQPLGPVEESPRQADLGGVFRSPQSEHATKQGERQ